MKNIINIILIFLVGLTSSFVNLVFCQTGEAVQLSPSCNINTGKMSVTVTASQVTYPFPYTYIIYNEDEDFTAQKTVSSNNTIFDGIPSGEYLIKVLLNPTTELRFCGEILDEIQLVGVVSPSCSSNSGTIALSVTGGMAPYTFKWSNGATSSYIDNLSVNEYSVTVTDVNGCKATKDFTVEATEKFELTIFDTWFPTCNEISVIIWYVNGVDPTGKYNFEWSNGTQGPLITSNEPGAFSVTITNKNSGCEHVENFDLVDHQFSFTDNVSQPTCEIGGSINLDVVTNTPGLPVRYKWSDSNADADRINLPPGQYCVTITSGYVGKRECNKTKCFTIIAPPFTVSSSIIQTNCSGLPSSVVLQSIATNPWPQTFSYKWDDGGITPEKKITHSGKHC